MGSPASDSAASAAAQYAPPADAPECAYSLSAAGRVPHALMLRVGQCAQWRRVQGRRLPLMWRVRALGRGSQRAGWLPGRAGALLQMHLTTEAVAIVDAASVSHTRAPHF